MASSFISQIPVIINLISRLQPKSVLDVGKGFGKYGFLIHEYVGIDNKKRIIPNLKLKEQSRLIIDAVEVDETLALPHLNHIYNKIIFGNILETYDKLNNYELIIMIDVIEHLEKTKAIKMLKYFLHQKCTLIISSPRMFFQQHLYESKYEEHISHWAPNDFRKIGFTDYQKTGDGIVYLLSFDKKDIRGFGNSLIKRLRRIFHSVHNELI